MNHVDVVAANQHGGYGGNPLEPLLGVEPSHCRLGAGEALENDPVDLGRRARRHNRLLDEAGKGGDDGAGLFLPMGEGVGALGPHPGLRHDGDGTLRLSGASAVHADHG